MADSKLYRLVAASSLAASLTFLSTAPAAAQAAEETLTNQSVVAMVVGKLNKDLILAKITSAKNEFDVTTSGIVNLHQSKVSQDVIRAMISAATDPKLGNPKANAGELLTNQAIIAMTSAGVPRQLATSKIGNTANEFDVTVNGVVSLTQNKVHTEVLAAMINAAADSQLGRSKENAAEVLSNQSIIALVTGKVAKQIIMTKIQQTKVDFDVTSGGMVTLNQNKVPQDIIKAMVVRSSGGN
jgi:hypothetical protein